MQAQTSNHPFARASNVRFRVAEIIRPPRRMRPSEAAQQYLRNDRGAWDAELAPEMIEPMDLMAGREYTGIVFVGPARSSKTYSLVWGSVCYIVCCAPGDTLITQMSQDAARDFSRMEADRVIRYSPEIGSRLSPRAKDDNTYDKFFRSGMALKLGWPAISQLSGKTLHYVIVTDYDRPENRDDVDGEGPLWNQIQKRTETYMSRGKCLIESSPGEEIRDGNWQPSTPHEAPPVPGILSIYNEGTRARRYWPCKHTGCGEFFEAKPGTAAFELPTFEECEKLVATNDPMSLAERYARVHCPHCGGEHLMSDRAQMKQRGVWLHEGESIDAAGRITGTRRRTTIASYWLGGVAASYQRWDSMLLKYFQGVATYARTAEETSLKATIFTDFAAPYLPRLEAKRRTPEQFKNRLEDWPRGSVPSGVRFLTTCVDTQSSSFRVNVFGWGPGLESWLIDRFALAVSKRTDQGRPCAVDPASYIEDWNLIIDEALGKEYPVEGTEGFSLAPRLVLVDSGGKEGVTSKAYEFWRSLRAKALSNRIQLLKGDHRQSAPRVLKAWPDTRKTSRHAIARGDVPVWLLNVNVLKDAIAGDLAREVPGPGYHHIPSWVDADYFQQITAEVKNGKGEWVKHSGRKNEDWDLHVYNRAAVIILGAEKINWSNPPDWALDTQAQQAKVSTKTKDIGAIARSLND